jgi:MoaA/NifB/PqqE/SkfB family radical SAM enzyme
MSHPFAQVLSRFFSSRRPQKNFSAWQIELTTRCALRCRMCCREGHHHLARKDMEMENFRKILPYLPQVETAVLEGWGESLLHPRLTEIIRLVKGAGAQVGFVTSGMTLEENYILDLVRAGTDFIGFSFAGARPETHDFIRANSHLPALLGDIRKFQEIKMQQKSSTPRLHIVYLLLKNNIEELPDLINLAKDLGIDRIFLIHLALISNAWQEEQRIFAREEITQYEKILDESAKMARDLKISLRRPPMLPQEVAVCSEDPLRNLYISVNGNVSPCVYLRPPLPSPFQRIFHATEYKTEKVGFGNIFQQPLREIWENPAYQKFRQCFSDRRTKIMEMAHAFWNADRRRSLESHSLPPAPVPCQTCYKIEGF